MISTRLASQKDILASLKPNEKFSFEGDDEEYYYIENGTFEYIIWNDTKKQVRKLNNSTYKNSELKIKKL